MLTFRRAKQRAAGQDLAHYGTQCVRDIRDPADGTRCLYFQNHMLADFIGELLLRTREPALQELLRRYRIERNFPDLSNFRLGPNMFDQTPLDWIAIVGPADREGTELIAHGIATRIFWDGDAAHLPRGWMGAVRKSYQDAIVDRRPPNTLVGLFIYAEAAFRQQGWAAKVATAMKELAAKEGLRGLIIPLRLPTAYEMSNAGLPYEEFALRTRSDGEYKDHWLRMHVKLGAKVLGVCRVSHQHALHPEDLQKQFECPALLRTGEHIVKLRDEYYAAYVDLEREFTVINEGCVWVLHPLT